jgi:iron complex outermembrane receptor protein
MKETVLAHALRMMFAGSAAALMAMPAWAQQHRRGEKMQRVEVTGSSVKRADSETALPVQMISKQDIQRIGATSTESLLASIASLSSAGATSSAAGASTGTSGLASISLRGLGAERTLVLVNGRRLAAFASGGGATVNVNVIPLAAIERIEVLKDGASGVYGSDAVAGVVNFILSKNFEGLEIAGGAGSPTTHGGAQNQKASLVGGLGKLDTDGYSAVLSASWEKEKALFGRDRDYAKSGNNMPYYVSGATGQGNIEGAVIPGAYPNDRAPGFGASPATGYGNPLAAQGKCADIQMFKNPTLSSKGAPYCAYDSASDVNLLPARELANVTGNLTYKINDQHQLFADALLSRSVVTQTIQTSPVRRSFLVVDSAFTQQKVDPALILYPSNPVYQSIAVPYLQAQGFSSLIGQPLAITSRVFDFGPRQSRDVATQSRFVGGARHGVGPGLRGGVLGQPQQGLGYAAVGLLPAGGVRQDHQRPGQQLESMGAGRRADRRAGGQAEGRAVHRQEPRRLVGQRHLRQQDHRRTVPAGRARGAVCGRHRRAMRATSWRRAPRC